MSDSFMRGTRDIKSTERVAYMLNEDAIPFFRPATRKQKLFDEKGLYLLLMPSGSRLWRFKYRFPPRVPGNKEKCISLGAYPEVSLERARKRRDAARLDVVNGTDPSLRRLQGAFRMICAEVCNDRASRSLHAVQSVSSALRTLFSERRLKLLIGALSCARVYG